ncbi:hypothetical protein MQK76_15805 [Vibrio cholerae]|uniref:alpha-glutamyl/putrescinyl thymine pyrophosphorylase clade 3 protein n=1 Tax=Vibrio cholerae TaxID=666 RepID=UPI0021D17FAA|nr:hypothetical protein [Vibrio cholerae]MCU4218298.1 hypothetical protein [Vibrio cholerae]HCZ9559236.1 hypothetical protein [Vibrio cholerae]HCZ9562763.1 hypothetical protein [Vibrio cholerae]HCZ9572906.1 hypothetical protein [Vibrio cholerae]HCZ9574059.1 hypothetical protein [Vibrio cholerae]
MKKLEVLNKIESNLYDYNKENHLKGLLTSSHYSTLSKQILDSIRRIEYVRAVGKNTISVLRANPHSDIFDPIRAAWWHKNNGNYDEACWLVFLSTHFGKNKKTGWRLCKDIYGGLGEKKWDWESISENIENFKKWYENAYIEICNDNIQRSFGNHRKYETLKPYGKRSLPKVIESYVKWIGGSKSHLARFSEAEAIIGQTISPEGLFDILYKDMKSVVSFGRTAKFDYLTMLTKIGLIELDPKDLYLSGATGPLSGSKLLLFNDKKHPISINNLNDELYKLSQIIPVKNLKMQIMEDALCNWQKSPDIYKYFGG